MATAEELQRKMEDALRIQEEVMLSQQQIEAKLSEKDLLIYEKEIEIIELKSKLKPAAGKHPLNPQEYQELLQLRKENAELRDENNQLRTQIQILEQQLEEYKKDRIELEKRYLKCMQELKNTQSKVDVLSQQQIDIKNDLKIRAEEEASVGKEYVLEVVKKMLKYRTTCYINLMKHLKEKNPEVWEIFVKCTMQKVTHKKAAANFLSELSQSYLPLVPRMAELMAVLKEELKNIDYDKIECIIAFPTEDNKESAEMLERLVSNPKITAKEAAMDFLSETNYNYKSKIIQNKKKRRSYLSHMFRKIRIFLLG